MTAVFGAWNVTTSPGCRGLRPSFAMVAIAPRRIDGDIDAPRRMNGWWPVRGAAMPRAASATANSRTAVSRASVRRRRIVVPAGIRIRAPRPRNDVRPAPLRGRVAASSGASGLGGLRVVGRLFGVEGEGGRRRAALVRVGGSDRERRAKAELLAGRSGQGAVAHLGAGRTAAECRG